jgi:hypothetical protein
MREDTPGLGGPLGPLEFIKRLPEEAFAESDRLRWVCQHCKRLVGVTPGQFRTPATIA